MASKNLPQASFVWVDHLDFYRFKEIPNLFMMMVAWQKVKEPLKRFQVRIKPTISVMPVRSSSNHWATRTPGELVLVRQWLEYLSSVTALVGSYLHGTLKIISVVLLPSNYHHIISPFSTRVSSMSFQFSYILNLLMVIVRISWNLLYLHIRVVVDRFNYGIWSNLSQRESHLFK